VGEIWEVMVVCEGRKRRERVGQVFEVRVPCPGDNFGGRVVCTGRNRPRLSLQVGPTHRGDTGEPACQWRCGGIPCGDEGFPDLGKRYPGRVGEKSRRVNI
jgi:hypothetical protein